MVNSTLIIADELRRILHYEPLTGAWTWLPRKGRGHHPGSAAGWIDRYGYHRLDIGRRQYQAHRLTWLYMTSEWPKEIDHINGIRNDNRLVQSSRGYAVTKPCQQVHSAQ